MITEKQRELLREVDDGTRFSLEYYADLGELFSAGLIDDNGVTAHGHKAMAEFDAEREPEPVNHHPLARTEEQFGVLETIWMGKAGGRRPSDNGRLGSGIGKPGDAANTITKMRGHAVAAPVMAFKVRGGMEGGGCRIAEAMK